jgi:hypothetical protein
MLNPHEIKTYAVPFSWDKTDMSPILTTNIILTKNTALFRSSHNLMKEELYTYRRQKIKSKPIRPSLSWLSSNKMEINFKE